jgi:hypothetical protein
MSESLLSLPPQQQQQQQQQQQLDVFKAAKTLAVPRTVAARLDGVGCEAPGAKIV